MNKVPGSKTPGVTSNQMDEIQARLRNKETQKAMRLLAQATSYYDALKITKDRITKQVLLNGHDPESK